MPLPVASPGRPRPAGGRSSAALGARSSPRCVVAAGCLPPPPPPPPPLTPMPDRRHARRRHAPDRRSSTRSRPTPAVRRRTPGRRRAGCRRRSGTRPTAAVRSRSSCSPTATAARRLRTRRCSPRIAAAGYVVAAPTYPLLSGQPAGPTDTVGLGRPRARHVVRHHAGARAVERRAIPTIGGLIDPTRIAVAGHSDGAAIAFGDRLHAVPARPARARPSSRTPPTSATTARTSRTGGRSSTC